MHNCGELMKKFFREKKDNFQIYNSGNPNFPPHLHDDIEIMYISRGEGYGFCDDVKYTLKKGDYFLVFPNQIHCYTDFPPESECILLTVNPSYFTSYADIFDEKSPLSARYTSNENDQNLINIFKIIFEEHLKNSPKNTVISIISAFLRMLLDRYSFSDINTQNSCALKIINYCKKHYKEELTIDIISKELHISRSHISHTFNDRLKISFPTYINSLRLIESIKLLDKKDFSITEIAQLSGFQTIRSFNRIFKNHFGFSPKEYLKNQNFKSFN